MAKHPSKLNLCLKCIYIRGEGNNEQLVLMKFMDFNFIVDFSNNFFSVYFI